MHGELATGVLGAPQEPPPPSGPSQEGGFTSPSGAVLPVESQDSKDHKDKTFHEGTGGPSVKKMIQELEAIKGDPATADGKASGTKKLRVLDDRSWLKHKALGPDQVVTLREHDGPGQISNISSFLEVPHQVLIAL